ncbi:MAG TPA: outer membrane beta-barrel protein [Steroidobacteraceae bacterium]|nr:outer membrane beta-barrel protein [Steroidobacteraceae bacterium]
MSQLIKRAVPVLAVAMAVRVALAQAPVPVAARPDVDVAAPGGLTVLEEELEEVVVEGRRLADIQQAVTEVVSILSAEDIARTGEGDIAGALSFVPGLSVVGGGFVYVRGLGDRYSLALLNGSPLPSPEPLRRAVPLDLFPTDVVASSMVQKTYSPNYPGEFGGGVINLTTVAIPKMPFLNIGAGISGDSGTTGQLGYDHFGGKYDWTGYDAGARTLPSGLRDFLASGERISSGTVDSGEIARQFVGWRNGLVQEIGSVPANWSGSLTGGTSWSVGGGELGLVGTAGYSNKWRTRDNLEQTPGSIDLSATDKDYRSVATENRIVTNALLGVGFESGGNRLRWTNLYIHDTLKRTSLAEGQWNVTYAGDWDFREQSTGWYERQLMGTQLTGTLALDPLTINSRASLSRSSREAPFEVSMGYSRSNNPMDPYGAYFVNKLSSNNRNYATVAFSDLDEDLVSAGADASLRAAPGVVLSAGYDYAYTARDSSRREFQLVAPQSSEWLNSGVPLLRPDALLGAGVIEHFGISLRETTETDPAFAARLMTHAAFAQVQAQFGAAVELSAGARFERGKQVVRPEAVFNSMTNSGAANRIENDYLLPAATLTWKFGEGRDRQIRLNVSRTIARPQFRELLFQRYFDPEANREYLGNPLLEDSEFLNGEARYEHYFATGQRFSVAGFYKQIDKPIEAYTYFPQSTPETSFANAPEAELHGIEAEVQKYFRLDGLADGEGGAIGNFLGQRRVVAIGNYTFTDSSIKVGAGDTTEIYGSAVTTRPASNYFVDGARLTGQSRHLVNLQLGLERPDRLSQQTILVSYASDRVTSRSSSAAWPDIHESPGLRVDFVVRQGLSVFGQSMDLKLEARNLLGRGYREYQKNGSNFIYYNRYAVGTSFSASVGMTF